MAREVLGMENIKVKDTHSWSRWSRGSNLTSNTLNYKKKKGKVVTIDTTHKHTKIKLH